MEYARGGKKSKGGGGGGGLGVERVGVPLHDLYREVTPTRVWGLALLP